MSTDPPKSSKFSARQDGYLAHGPFCMVDCGPFGRTLQFWWSCTPLKYT